MDRDTYFYELGDRLQPDELRYVQKAYWLVKQGHRGQFRRLTGERYFEHVRRVSFSAIAFGYGDVDTLTLGLLHDTIEDTYVPQDILVGLFGQTMYEWILKLSKDLPVFHPICGKVMAKAKVPDDVYYPALAVADIHPRIVKSLDRLDNVADLARWDTQRREKYIRETVNLVLPIVKNTDTRIAEMIEQRLRTN